MCKDDKGKVIDCGMCGEPHNIGDMVLYHGAHRCKGCVPKVKVEDRLVNGVRGLFRIGRKAKTTMGTALIEAGERISN